MRISTLRLLGASLMALSLSGVAMAQKGDSGCSNATVAGSWGFTTSGTVVLPSGPAPVLVVGRFNLDQVGNLDGTQTRSLNPFAPDRETITGTILVNPDCTATLSVNVFHSGVLNRTSTLDLVFENNLREFRGVFTSAARADGTPVGTVLRFDGKRQFTDD